MKSQTLILQLNSNQVASAAPYLNLVLAENFMPCTSAIPSSISKILPSIREHQVSRRQVMGLGSSSHAGVAEILCS